MAKKLYQQTLQTLKRVTKLEFDKEAREAEAEDEIVIPQPQATPTSPTPSSKEEKEEATIPLLTSVPSVAVTAETSEETSKD